MANKSRAGGRKTTPIDTVAPGLLEETERAVRDAKAMPLTKLTRLKLTAGARTELERQLVERGLERGGKAIRVPVEVQIKDLVRGNARVPLKEVSKRVKGAAKAEIDRVLGRLVRSGETRVVVRTATHVLVAPGERVLDDGELERLKRLSERLSKALKKLGGKGPPSSILRDDVDALLDDLELSPSPAGRAPAKSVRLVDAALRQLEDERLKLVPVPDLVRSLAGQLSMAEVHDALSAAAGNGAIELRPATGGELLSPEDAHLCPPGPRGTLFSHARRISP